MPAVELSAQNAAGYLAAQGWPVAGARISTLGGGVSNVVLLIETAERRVVLKQSLEKLRVEDDWRAQRDRIMRECACIRELHQALPAECLPQVVFEDAGNFCFAMTAAPAGARTWKADLLDGRIELDLAARAGELLARMHAFSCANERIRAAFGDQTCFEQLRVDPYYRTVMQRRPEVAAPVGELIDEMHSRRLALVHGDYSPKNMLVMRDGGSADLFLIDFEVVHYGDPAFDTGFCLNHLLLKSFHRPRWRRAYLDAARAFWRSYCAGVPPAIGNVIEAATCRHLGALMLARVDGKSPAEYLEPETRDRVRAAAVAVLTEGPATLEDLLAQT